jgi:HEAT repeat protein
MNMKRAKTPCRRTIVRSVPVWALLFSVPCAARMTAAAADAECRDILQQGLDSKNPDTRKQAVVALSLVPVQFLKSLEAMLQDKDAEVRLATVASLAEAKSPQAAMALRSALNDEVPEVGFAAAKALWTLHDTEGTQALLAILAGDSQTSSSFFSKQKRDAVRMIHTPRVMLQFAMNKGMGFVPIPAFGLGVSSMQSLITDAGASGRAAAALMLASERDQSSLQALRTALNDSDWSVRAAAVHALALRRDPRLRTALEPLLLETEKEAVRFRAAAACIKIGRSPAKTSTTPTR